MAALDEECQPGRSSVRVTVDEKTFVLCSLIAGQVEQQSLDLVFTEGEEITFTVSGENAVHLSGNFLPADVVSMDSDDEEDDEDEDEDDLEGHSGVVVKRMDNLLVPVGGDDEDDDSEEDPDFTGGDDSDEDEDDSDDDGSDNNNQDANDDDSEDDGDDSEDGDDESEDDDDDDDESEDDDSDDDKRTEKKREVNVSKRPAESDSVVSKKQKVTEQKVVPVRPKEEPKKEEAKKKGDVKDKDDASKEKKSNTKTLPSGLVIEDTATGEGARAKAGKKVGVRYLGRLANGKIFDKNLSGKPFSFRLGGGEVIKGWDIGIQGMQLNGERRLTIPPALAYGAQGVPPEIPRNATLTFEVKLVSLK